MVDAAFERLLRDKFLEDTQVLFANAAPALSGLVTESQASIAFDQLYRVAHNFKSGALTVGFEKLGRFAEELEARVSVLRRQESALDAERKASLARGFQELERIAKLLRADPAASYEIQVKL